MAARDYRIIGQVIDGRTKQGVPRLRVEAWDKDTRYHDLLDVAITDNDGKFTIAFDDAYFGDYAPDRLPDVFFKVWRGDKLVKSTEDKVMTNFRLRRSEVTIEIDQPVVPAAAADRVTERQTLGAVEFLRKSDFRGVWNDTVDKGKTWGGFVADIIKSGISEFSFTPVKPPETRTSSIVHQDVVTAEQNLARSGVKVRDVKSYNPRTDQTSVKALGEFPVALRPTDTVDLYEENGKVRYYTVVEEPKPAEIHAEDVARLHEEVSSIKVDLREIPAVKAELESVKATEQQVTTKLTGDVGALREQIAAVDTMKSELVAVRRASVQKDEMIAGLKQEIDSLRTAHAELARNAAPERFLRLEEDIRKLREVRGGTEPRPRARKRKPRG